MGKLEYGMGQAKPTKYEELGWVQVGQGREYKYVDMHTQETIGPIYESKMEMLADLERFYIERFK